MLIYFDESYDKDHTYLLLGALFNPQSKKFHRQVLAIKKKHAFYDREGNLMEVKYNTCFNKYNFEVCKEVIDAFFESSSWFRCVVISQKGFDYGRFGGLYESLKIKKARAYKKFAELLIYYNTRNITNAVLLADELTRCRGDEFIEMMQQEFSRPGQGHCVGQDVPILKHIAEVRSHLEPYQLAQVGDLLLGCVLNNLLPTKNPWKNEIRRYLTNKLIVTDLLPETWQDIPKRQLDMNFPKFQIWYWKPK